MDAAPFIKDSRAMLPLRYAGESLGADVAWDPTLRQATLTLEGDTVLVTLGSNELQINGEVVVMDTMPVIVEGRMYLPIKWIGLTLGYESSSPLYKEGRQIRWDPESKQVTIERID